ncbi:MAG: 16S rRNA (guanine(966)-N(2))-methyltransferase RsmD [Lachnospiraceae bacterium]|jgi:16S rRNA (guanine966-N2)-methyltransferase|nr:16S rRNA (guanine(966)-N(2))-methyltransferase RsmD [Lachnospiraceae bacterium]MCR5440550.1 16S rRNA (guanine(966)-N(2))-methyltransferase RsmD [Lachnospiraceae bacterium]
MRVIAGECRSMPLKTPAGDDITRPTQDIIKETLFNIIQGDVPGAVMIDLFAGSGQIGIEALSRGATKVYFIDNGREPIKCITDNVNFTKMQDKAVILKQDAVAGLQSVFEKHVDIVFMDAPYLKGYEKNVLKQLSVMRYVDKDTIIIIEADKKDDFSYTEEVGFEIVRRKEYKGNMHLFLKKI